MADDRDDELSRRYRDLACEEPPRALDDAILAAARRELETRPAPLVAPAGRRRWAVPIAAAAVIVLSAVVTLHVQREQPDEELAAPQAPHIPAKKDEAPAIAARPQMQAEAPRAEARKAEPERLRKQAAPAPKLAKPVQAPAGEAAVASSAPQESRAIPRSERFSPDPAPIAAAPPPPAPAAAAAPQAQVQPAAPAAQSAPHAADSAASSGPPAVMKERRALGGLRDSPGYAYREDKAESAEKMLDRISMLRREGRAREADDLYAEFKRRYPDYRIPDAMRDQVVPR